MRSGSEREEIRKGNEEGSARWEVFSTACLDLRIYTFSPKQSTPCEIASKNKNHTKLKQ